MRTSVLPTEMIELDDLRVGMFIHLDMSWMSHPFPLGSFRIASAAQIATIHGLGVPRLRWSPAQSVLPDAASAPGEAHGFGLAAMAGADAGRAPSEDLLLTAALPLAATETETETETETAAGRRLPWAALAAQRAALKVVERQFEEAARDLRQVHERVAARPAEARAGAEQLANALVDKMVGEHDLCIRLLTEAAGDKAAAHALNVTVVALLMGRAFGMPATELQDLGVGALLHDVGKIDLPDRVRHAGEHFGAAETRCYEGHVAHGVAHARRMALTPGATLVIAQHHEHADGSGFPLKLSVDRMSAAGRIVALANRYDNLCNPHNPAKALTPHESLSLLFAQGHAKFDTAILGAFIRMMGVYPAGSAVQLTDDRHALVVGVNSSRPLKPRVIVHEPDVPREEAMIVDLEATNGIGIRRSVRPSQLPPEVLAYLAPRPRVAYFFEAIDAPHDELAAA